MGSTIPFSGPFSQGLLRLSGLFRPVYSVRPVRLLRSRGEGYIEDQGMPTSKDVTECDRKWSYQAGQAAGRVTTAFRGEGRGIPAAPVMAWNSWVLSMRGVQGYQLPSNCRRCLIMLLSPMA